MTTVIIHGQAHEGSTYHIAHELAEKIGGEQIEFFLPKDFPHFCGGCTLCFKDEGKCPHAADLAPIVQAMDLADVIILASPVYVYHATGAMKAFLDHLGYRWMVHRPRACMFKKQGVCVATAAGAGMKSTMQDMADSLYFWGIAKQYRLGFAVAAVNWDGVADKKKALISRKTDALARAIRRRNGKAKPGLKTKAFFFLMRLLQKKGWNESDVQYWNEMGWAGKTRPWK
ncbi:MAG: NAD(P)H-dependent oxidoreductase [Treponema sp.]|nr:NAD(P)H-dependent oxidoreductase [Treponema sp.]